MNKAIFFLILMFSVLSQAQTEKMKVHVLRLKPGQDVLKEISNYLNSNKILAGSILSVVGSVSQAELRFANKKEGTKLSGPLEVVALSGTTSTEGSHLHMSVSDGQGATLGGHLLEGNKVFTTLEIVLAEYPELIFKRKLDPTFGYKELDIQKKSP